MEELLELTRENNLLLKEIVSWVRTESSQSHRTEQDLKNLVTNIIANILLLQKR